VTFSSVSCLATLAGFSHRRSHIKVIKLAIQRIPGIQFLPLMFSMASFQRRFPLDFVNSECVSPFQGPCLGAKYKESPTSFDKISFVSVANGKGRSVVHITLQWSSQITDSVIFSTYGREMRRWKTQILLK
jgi:hypothetical protein